ncbi:ArsR/SmtB family transcription factor [Alcaligenes endophyticus]|uniref:Metalloregulator ArsR/SmtB family transcription factor n=1 Tax=Alcaligenes endophyticus TaxID=1929088 RepID=A0ABT8ELF4_9BURK|nr:metalloregulator ArsR/SmtB family transcription factor [Alcaligenes endophyticus]MCX5590521.1 metalloregulator ArsR/SmtB family transcription factor [Alcaligenes endophyticus]MDN4122115.1 metalloregulator ArsR/SmtB family transcription factor [Alcaligenes endophyticus]
MNPEALQLASSEASSLLRKLANPDRLLILCALAKQELNVGQLFELCQIAQPTLSQQLAVLRNEGLVQVRREGKYMFYSLHHPDVLFLMQTLYQIYCAPKEAQDEY